MIGPTIKLVVTGDSGVVGSRLVPRLREAHHVVAMIDRRRGQQDDLSVYSPHWTQFFAGCDAVVHLAWEVIWQDARANDPLRQIQALTASANVLRACTEFGVSTFVFASSRSVTEEARPDFFCYAAAKRFFEQCLETHARATGMAAASIRVAGIAPKERPDLESQWTDDQLASIFARALAEAKPGSYRCYAAPPSGEAA